MQIVIDISDIPKNDHERYIKSHGTPLDKVIEDIKAEIANRLGLLDCKKDILAIIDKHTNSVGKIDYRAYSDLYADLHDICMPIFEEML